MAITWMMLNLFIIYKYRMQQEFASEKKRKAKQNYIRTYRTTNEPTTNKPNIIPPNILLFIMLITCSFDMI